MAPENADRFLDYPTPGAQEWWYFDAISDDGRDVLVLVWYAALPFDPDYGVAAIRHLDRPDRYPAPVARDHCAFGISWYRDGKTMAYALNGYRSADFRQRDEPFSVAVSTNQAARDPLGYAIRVETPAVDGRSRISGDLRFDPAPSTEPIVRNLGTDASPHLWLLAAPDCAVSGTVRIEGRTSHSLEFRGRGYHDHNAGAGELSRSQDRWAWGRAHIGPLTQIYYRSESRQSGRASIWITCRDGRPEVVRDGVDSEESGRSGNVFGLRHGREFVAADGPSTLRHSRDLCVDDGPFYRRWVGKLTIRRGDGPAEEAPGIGEWLDTRNLNRRLFNWMIPYRLKKPAARID